MSREQVPNKLLELDSSSQALSRGTQPKIDSLTLFCSRRVRKDRSLKRIHTLFFHPFRLVLLLKLNKISEIYLHLHGFICIEGKETVFSYNIQDYLKITWSWSLPISQKSISKSVLCENNTSTDKSHMFWFLNKNFKASVNCIENLMNNRALVRSMLILLDDYLF